MYLIPVFERGSLEGRHLPVATIQLVVTHFFFSWTCEFLPDWGGKT